MYCAIHYPDERKNKMSNEIALVSSLLWSNRLLTLPVTNKLTTIFVEKECCVQFIICTQIFIKIQFYLVGWKDMLSYSFRARVKCSEKKTI